MSNLTTNLTTADRLKELLPELFSTKKAKGDYYLRFKLTAGVSGLINLKHVRESLNVNSDRITPIPNLPDYILGLMSSKNQVFLAMDLAHLAGLSPQTVNLRQYQTIVVQAKRIKAEQEIDEANLLGLAVKNIEGISRIMPDRVDAIPDNTPDILQPFISGVVRETNSKLEVDQEQKYLYLIDLPTLIKTKAKF